MGPITWTCVAYFFTHVLMGNLFLIILTWFFSSYMLDLSLPLDILEPRLMRYLKHLWIIQTYPKDQMVALILVG